MPLAPGEKVFLPVPDRWNLNLPEWDRYGGGDYPYVTKGTMVEPLQDEKS